MFYKKAGVPPPMWKSKFSVSRVDPSSPRETKTYTLEMLATLLSVSLVHQPVSISICEIPVWQLLMTSLINKIEYVYRIWLLQVYERVAFHAYKFTQLIVMEMSKNRR